jgi:hypothetical protein
VANRSVSDSSPPLQLYELGYDWMSGPKEDLGYEISPPFEHSEDEHTAGIRDFSQTPTFRQAIHAGNELPPTDARSLLPVRKSGHVR